MVFSEAPAIAPENRTEEVEFETKYKSMWKVLKIESAIRGRFMPAGYRDGFRHSAAYGYVADSLRAASCFQQFELLYKVVEYFFEETSSALPGAVSAHVAPHDATFTPVAIERLRSMRNRCTHPRARKGHINPENIAHAREVDAALPQMRRLSGLLLAHPTF